MAAMKRRTFLRTATTAAAATTAGAFAILKYPRGARAAGWGDWPTDKEEALLPENQRATNVLELHVNGGMSIFDSFYTIPTWGTSDYRFLWVYSNQNPANAGLPVSATIEGRWEECNNNVITQPGELYVPLGAQDTDGNSVYLGPWAYPFRERPDVLSRMRIVVQAHDSAAHEGANPISFTGSRLGQPRMAGVGTAIQRYFTENVDAPGGGGVRAAPYSYVIYPAGYKPFNAVAATTVGFHPGSARPLVVSVDPASELSTLLARTSVDDREAFDKALAYYRATYETRLRAFGHATPARSAERANYEFASFARTHAPELTEILQAELFQSITPPATICEDPQGGDDMPAMQARMAASLLTRPTDQARYVMWIDAGINPSVTGGHDTHSQSVELNGGNLPHTFAALLDHIRDPDNPRPGDDQRIDLDTTMIVINTEFGRTPDIQGTTGTNHHPEGYVNVFIGGPIEGTSVYGHMTEAEGFAQNYVRPSENRMMILQAMGIYPFSSQSFNVADVQESTDDADAELNAAQRIRDVYLGVTV
jgi:hypothetical protein